VLLQLRPLRLLRLLRLLLLGAWGSCLAFGQPPSKI
jgi:hypothetical protein